MLKNILVVIGLAFLLFVFLAYSADRDRKIQQAAESYEKCIFANYGGRTPAEIYASAGEYPECPSTNE